MLTVHQAMQQREKLDDVALRAEIESDILSMEGDVETAAKIFKLHIRAIMTCLHFCDTFDLKAPAYTRMRYAQLRREGL
jgi:hypothetical protein